MIFGKKQAGISLPEMQSELEEYQAELYEELTAHYEGIEALLPKVRRADVRDELSYMQDVTRRIAGRFQTHPHQITSAQKFVKYYQDRTLSLTKELISIEAAGADTGKLEDGADRIASMFPELSAAFRDTLEKLYESQLIEVDAELAVMKDALKADGVEKVERKALEGEILWNPSSPALKAKSGKPSFMSRLKEGFGVMPEYMPEEMRGQMIREKVINGALAVLLGGFGAHKFYRGKTMMGALYFLFSWTFLPSLISFVEGIRFFFMPADDFYESYYRKDEMKRIEKRRNS